MEWKEKKGTERKERRRRTKSSMLEAPPEGLRTAGFQLCRVSALKLDMKCGRQEAFGDSEAFRNQRTRLNERPSLATRLA